VGNRDDGRMVDHASSSPPSGDGDEIDDRRNHVASDVPRRPGLGRVVHMAISTPIEIRRRLLARRDTDRAVEMPATTPDDISRPPLDFEAFYRSHYPSVVRLAYSLCGSMPVAEELAQEAFVTAHGRWRRVVGFDRPDLWVRRVVINRSISFRRREASERKAFARIRVEDEPASEPFLADEVVWQALRELSPRQAEVLALFYVEDHPMAAVAEILGLGPETVKTHLKRGRAALAAKLDEMGHAR